MQERASHRCSHSFEGSRLFFTLHHEHGGCRIILLDFSKAFDTAKHS